jgi:hypothetical protein
MSVRRNTATVCSPEWPTMRPELEMPDAVARGSATAPPSGLQSQATPRAPVKTTSPRSLIPPTCSILCGLHGPAPSEMPSGVNTPSSQRQATAPGNSSSPSSGARHTPAIWPRLLIAAGKNSVPRSTRPSGGSTKTHGTRPTRLYRTYQRRHHGRSNPRLRHRMSPESTASRPAVTRGTVLLGLSPAGRSKQSPRRARGY